LVQDGFDISVQSTKLYLVNFEAKYEVLGFGPVRGQVSQRVSLFQEVGWAKSPFGLDFER